MSLGNLERTLKHLDDIMEVEGERSDQGVALRHLLKLEFPPHLKKTYSSIFEVDMIFDDSYVYNLCVDDNNNKKPVVVEGVIEHGAAKIFFVKIDRTSFVMKCSKKEIANRYQSFYKDDKMLSVVEREASCYRRATKNKELGKICLAMYGHGNLLEYEIDKMTGQTHYVVKEVWEAILIQKGSKIDLSKYSADTNYSVNTQNINMLTMKCFEMIRLLHLNDITHGDAKLDQFIWESDGQVGSEKIKWLDFGRCLSKDTLNQKTWNLRRLIDLNLMLILNPYSISTRLAQMPYHQYNFYSIRQAFGSMRDPKWSNINGLPLSSYIIPHIGLIIDGAFYIVDEISTDLACKKYYPKEDTSFLENINIDEFFKFLFQGNNLIELIDAFHKIANRIGPKGLTVEEFLYEADFAKEFGRRNQKRPNQSRPDPSQSRLIQPSPAQNSSPKTHHVVPGQETFLFINGVLVYHRGGGYISFLFDGKGVSFFVTLSKANGGRIPAVLDKNVPKPAFTLDPREIPSLQKNGSLISLTRNGHQVYYVFTGQSIDLSINPDGRNWVLLERYSFAGQ